jgi:3-hydroxyisobutyrate dehydrogenase
MNIGFIGLGNMGRGMAANILKAGHNLAVFDKVQESALPLLEKGASWKSNPKVLAEDSDIVFTSLPGPKEVESVALGKNGIIEGIRPGSGYIDLSTNSPQVMRNIYQIFKEKGVDVLDSPVSGGKKGAETGKLALMVGGDEEVFKRYKPVLDAIGDKVSYNGNIGSGSVCKLVHNCVVFGMQSVLIECLTAGMKAGVEPRALWKTLKEGNVGRGGFLTHVLPSTLFKGTFEPASFSLNLGFKDVSLATSLGHEFNVPMPISNIVFGDLKMAIEHGWGDKDSTVSMLIQEERAGIQVRIPDAEIG